MAKLKVWNIIIAGGYGRGYQDYILEYNPAEDSILETDVSVFVKLRLRSGSRSGSLRLLLCDFDSVT